MLNNDKAQGATEYLIILAIVIIIALIVVAVMGGIPGIGTATRQRTSSSFWETLDVAVITHAVSAATDNMNLTLRNNRDHSISLGDMYVDGQEMTCSGNSLSTGQQTTCGVIDVTACSPGDAYSFDVSITYTDLDTDTEYTYTGEGHKLEGKCGN